MTSTLIVSDVFKCLSQQHVSNRASLEDSGKPVTCVQDAEVVYLDTTVSEYLAWLRSPCLLDELAHLLPSVPTSRSVLSLLTLEVQPCRRSHVSISLSVLAPKLEPWME